VANDDQGEEALEILYHAMSEGTPGGGLFT